MLNFQDKAIIQIHNSGIVDFESPRPEGVRAPLQTGGTTKSSLISTHQMSDQHAQSVVSSLRDRSADFGTSNGPAFVDGFAVLIFASGLALKSRHHSCQLLETL